MTSQEALGKALVHLEKADSSVPSGSHKTAAVRGLLGLAWCAAAWTISKVGPPA